MELKWIVMLTWIACSLFTIGSVCVVNDHMKNGWAKNIVGGVLGTFMLISTGLTLTVLILKDRF